MSEPLLLLLHVFSNAGCWASLLLLEKRSAEEALSGWCLFYFLWAAKNKFVGPMKKDMGIITFGFGAVGCFLLAYDGRLRVGPLSLTLTSAFFATLNYAFPVVGMLKIPSADRYVKTGLRLRRSETFARVFFYYCVSNLALWPTAFVLLHPRLKGDPFLPEWSEMQPVNGNRNLFA